MHAWIVYTAELICFQLSFTTSRRRSEVTVGTCSRPKGRDEGRQEVRHALPEGRSEGRQLHPEGRSEGRQLHPESRQEGRHVHPDDRWQVSPFSCRALQTFIGLSADASTWQWDSSPLCAKAQSAMTFPAASKHPSYVHANLRESEVLLPASLIGDYKQVLCLHSSTALLYGQAIPSLHATCPFIRA